MCGIFAYLGPENPLATCVRGLKGVESRGYDSAGIAGFLKRREKKQPRGKKHRGEIFFFKQTGSVDALARNIPPEKLALAIGHTRWATHGKPNDRNAHPQLDASSEPAIALVHNGAIDNYAHLKHLLERKGRLFRSDTDTEVIVQLIKEYYRSNLLEAFAKALKELEGSFAIVAIHKDHPDQILAAARSCPLAIGWNAEKKEHLISSDPNAFFKQGDLKVTFLENDQIAVVREGSLQVFDQNLEAISHKQVPFSARDLPEPSKEGFEHYMLKEIFDQPAVMANMLSKRTKRFPLLDELVPYTNAFSEIDQITLLGCGTSWHAALLASYLIEDVAKITTRAEIASEFRYRNPVLGKNSLVVAISQSGETADTIAALRAAKMRGVRTLSICNVNYSTLVREADHTLLLEAGLEISVCSTKAFTSQMAMLSLFCLHLAKVQSIPVSDVWNLRSLQSIAPMMKSILGKKEEIARVASRYAHYKKFIFLGRNAMYPASLEAALKLKEISGIVANGYPAAELKHGPIALIDESFPIVAFCANKQTHAKMVNNLLEVKARGAPILAITFEEDQEIPKIADDTILLPRGLDEWSLVFASTTAAQLLAYEIARIYGQETDYPYDIDKPRNLAKCVTVE